MSLQLILGSSGSGKSYQLYSTVVEKSIENPTANYIVIVPEQFTMQTQKDIVSLHPGKGVLNIDIVSFGRLAYRVFEEVGISSLSVLDDTGKSLVLRKILEDQKDNLKVFKNKIGMTGFVEEMKSILSELYQYGIGIKELTDMTESAAKKPLLQRKLADIKVVHESFKQYLEDKYITSEELLSVLCRVIDKSEIIKNSEITIDGFTGFTPIQYRLLGLLLQHAKRVTITITIPAEEADFSYMKEHELFHMSKTMIMKLGELIKANGVQKEKDIMLSGVPYRFRNNDSLAFLERNIFRYEQTERYHGQSNVKLYIAKNPMEESDYVANQIYYLIKEKGYRYREIAVITGDMEGYYRPLAEAFFKNKVPAFIDHKRNILKNPCVEMLRSVVKIIEKDFSYESVFRYLKSGMGSIKREDVDLIENYVLAMGIRGYRKWNKRWDRPTNKMSEETLISINNIRAETMAPLIKVLKMFKKKAADVSDFTKALYEFSVEQDMQNKLEAYGRRFTEEGKLSLAKEYAQTYKLVVDLLDKLVGLLGDEVLTIQEYSDVLDAGFIEIKVGVIPPSIDEVVVGDIERTRLKDIKALFFIGVNEGIIPKTNVAGGILSKNDREFLSTANFELSPTAKENTLIQKFYLYLNLTKPTEQLYLSYSNTGNDGKTKRPSYLINTVAGMYEDIEMITAKQLNAAAGITNKDRGIEYIANGIRNYTMEDLNELWKEVFGILNADPEYRPLLQKIINGAFYSNEHSKLDTATAGVLYGNGEIRSITRLEKYAACAYSHFVTYGLALAEREEHEIEASDIGNLYHNAIERVSAKISSGDFSWRCLSDEQRKLLVQEAVIETVGEYGNMALTSSARNAYLIRQLERVTDRTIWALKKHIESGKFEPAYYELGVEKGRVDRVDLYEDGENVYVKIIDYKSGNKRFDIVDTYYGLQMQLILYMGETIETLQAQYPQKELFPGAVFYYNIKDPFISKSELTDSIEKDGHYLKEFQMTGLVNKRPDIIAALDTSFEEGNKDSNIIKVKLTNTGVRADSLVATDTEFTKLIDYTKDKIKEMEAQIKSGNININPYKKGSLKPCDYCDYKAICGFDTRLPGSDYRKLNKLKTDEVWEKIMDVCHLDHL